MNRCEDCKYYRNNYGYGQCFGQKNAPRVDYAYACENFKSKILDERPQGEWNNHTVACLLADLFEDPCACNYCGIDEWLPKKCDFANKECPNVVGVACWEQFLKHRGEEK